MERLGRYRQYKSFSSTVNHSQGHFYEDIMAPAAETASGLICDAVATTSNLGITDRRKHKYAQEVFAAFCMHYCIVALSDPSKYCNVDDAIAVEVAERVYRNTLVFLKRKIDKGEPIVNLRRCLISWARRKFNTIFVSEHGKVEDGGNDQKGGKWAPKLPTESIDEIDDEEQARLATEVVKSIMEKAREQIENENLIADVNDLLSECQGRKILGKEDVTILCHAFGIGEGYELMKQCEIAKIIGRNEKYVSNHVKSALEKLRLFIMREDAYRHLKRVILKEAK